MTEVYYCYEDDTLYDEDSNVIEKNYKQKQDIKIELAIEAIYEKDKERLKNILNSIDCDKEIIYDRVIGYALEYVRDPSKFRYANEATKTHYQKMS